MSVIRQLLQTTPFLNIVLRTEPHSGDREEFLTSDLSRKKIQELQPGICNLKRKLLIDFAAVVQGPDSHQMVASENRIIPFSGIEETQRKVDSMGSVSQYKIPCNLLWSHPPMVPEKSLRPSTSTSLVTLLGIYALTLSSCAEIKDKFHDDLVKAISSMLTNEHLVVLGNFKILVETDRDAWSNCIWKFRHLTTGTLLMSRALCNQHFLFHQSTPQSVLERSKILSMALTSWWQGAALAKTNAMSHIEGMPLRQCCQNIGS